MKSLIDERLMTSGFITELDAPLKHDSDTIWVLQSPLIYYSELLCCTIEIPPGMQSDGSSVPRFPIVFWLYGDKCHREGVLHDYLCRIDCVPCVSLPIANALFFEAMKSRGKSILVRYPMWWGVCIGAWPYYHKHLVMDDIT